MSVFMRHEGCYYPSSELALDIHKVLPPATFVVRSSMERGFYLEPIEDFKLPARIYGKVPRYAERILRTFNSRPAVTGVLLVGEKGSGKTLLTKQISRLAAQMGYPTLVVNAPFSGDGFNTFLASITQPCVVLFDEFEKTYHASSDPDEPSPQAHLLTLLDGVFDGKKLYLLTANDKWRINDHMKNRPGRLYYFLEFHGVDDDFIREYCAENLSNKAHTERVVVVSRFCANFNFDMLQAMVEELNRYGESPDEVLDVLNVKPDFGQDVRYSYVLRRGDEELSDPSNDNIQEWSPELRPITVYYKTKKDNKTAYAHFTPGDIKALDMIQGVIEMESASGFSLSLKRANSAEASIDLKRLLQL